jgi:DNA-directed RNA polymerase II subunit RPB1
MARVSGQPFLFSYKEVKKINQVILGMLSPEEIERYSVVKIVNERIYNEKGEAERGAINDPCLGTMDKDSRCKSCYGTMSDCPGHFGHIDLARPVFHAGMLDFIRKVLRCVCFECSKVLAPRDEKGRKAMMSFKNRTVRFKRVFKASDGLSECKLNGCGNKQPKYRRKGLRIEVDFTGLDREGAMAM